MKRFVCLSLALFLGLPVFAGADNAESTNVETVGNVGNISTRAESKKPDDSSSQVMQPGQSDTKQEESKQDTPEDKAYKAKMIIMSNDIAKKIAQVQAKQKEIDTEVYLASTPPLEADKVILEEELRKLKMERDKMEAQESARKMALDLKNNTSQSRTP